MRSAQLMRSIAAQFPEFNITTFHEYYPFADQVRFPRTPTGLFISNLFIYTDDAYLKS